MSIITNADSYKSSHFLQDPPGVTHKSSYIEARGVSSDFPTMQNAKIVNFGLQSYLKSLEKSIKKIDRDGPNFFHDAELIKMHGLPMNDIGWTEIYQLGYLPVRIQALPEGLTVYPGVVQLQITNTDPRFPWLTSYLETALLRSVWYGSTVATVSREIKKDIYAALQKTSEDPNGQIGFKLHDFGARGATSEESATLGGMAHLVNFMGSDTLSAIVGAREYYNCDMAGYSIPAAEHSTITSWGRDMEVEAYRNMIKQFAGEGKLYAVVSDSYDIYNAVDNIWGRQLKEEVLAAGGTVVIRPDSGDPTTVVLYCLESLGKSFGFTTNKLGYKVLHPSVRIIQGDGVNPSSIRKILDRMIADKWSIDNIAFGMGGALLQKVDRDTFKYAMKASAKKIEGSDNWIGFSKDPVTDQVKRSKFGRQAVIKDGSGEYKTIGESELAAGEHNYLEDVFVDGKLVREQTFDQVRELAKL
jgi:nicotinamide phosphoribosyltransferase